MARSTKFDWNDLSYFLAVARAERLTVAAKRLGMEHSTVSRRIVALERALCTRLFNRLSTGYSLTPNGEQLLRLAEEMELVAGSILADVGGGDLALTGTVRIGAPDGFGSYFLAPRLGKLVQRHPGLEFELIAMPRMFSLTKREADIAITLSRPREGRLHAHRLTDYELGVYGAADYLTGAPPITCREDLVHHAFIGYAEDFIFSPELDYIPLLLRDLRPSLRSSNVIAQLHATVGGAGLCVLPCFMARREAGLARVLPADIRLTRSFWLISHAELRGLARVRMTLDFIEREARAAAASFMDTMAARLTRILMGDRGMAVRCGCQRRRAGTKPMAVPWCFHGLREAQAASTADRPAPIQPSILPIACSTWKRRKF